MYGSDNSLLACPNKPLVLPRPPDYLANISAVLFLEKYLPRRVAKTTQHWLMEAYNDTIHAFGQVRWCSCTGDKACHADSMCE